MGSRTRGPRGAVAVAVTIVLAAVLTACGTGRGTGGAGSTSAAATPEGPKPTLTLYSAQHSDIAKAWIAVFTKETGIPVKLRQGGDFDLANQIVAEGAASPADVFVTENSPALSLASQKGVLAPLDPAPP
jgi:iron(III) transport system substrate-binding protein